MNAAAPDIATLVPHTGSMRLLDSVVEWDAGHAVCHATSHRDPHNPLRNDGRLHALAAIEYAAQAMAVHGGLSGAHRGKPSSGYLLSLRDVTLERSRLDDLGPLLSVAVYRVSGDDTTHVYRFTVGDGNSGVVHGRATVMISPGPGS